MVTGSVEMPLCNKCGKKEWIKVSERTGFDGYLIERWECPCGQFCTWAYPGRGSRLTADS